MGKRQFAPPPLSKGFNLPAQLLAAIGGGSYDNVELKNKGGQTVKLTRFGYGLGTAAGETGGTFDTIDVKPKGVTLQRMPAGVLESGAEVELTSKTKTSRSTISVKPPPSLLASTSGTTRAGIIAGVAGLVIVGVAIYAMR